MTNGEKIKEAFPNAQIDYGSICVYVWFYISPTSFDIDWWNAEYKESTTKNEVKYCDRNICLRNEYNNVGCEDCEVTKSQEPTTKNDLEVQKAIEIIKADSLASYSVNEILSARDLAVEALKQTTTIKNDLGVDCIDRAQAQTEIEMNALRYTLAKERGGMGQVEWSDQLIKVSDAVDIIRNLPPVTPQEPKWIPVSERMPEEDTDVLVTLECGLIGIVQNKLADDDYGEPCYIWQDFEGEEHEVIAWMPLQQPYKAESEE